MVTKRAKSATALTRLLRNEEVPAVTALDALHLAKRKFLAGQRIDMGEIADELGVNRVTIYRWVGSREKLIAETLWWLTQRTFESAGRQVTAKGGQRVARILARYTLAVMSNGGMQAFLEREGETAMRFLTSRQGELQPRLVRLVQQLLAEQIAAGRLRLPIPAEEFAFLLTRLIESYVYRSFITGDPSDGSSIEAVLVHMIC